MCEGDTHATHITVHIIDDYMSLFPPLLPAFIMPALGLSISEVGWLATVFIHYICIIRLFLFIIFA